MKKVLFTLLLAITVLFTVQSCKDAKEIKLREGYKETVKMVSPVTPTGLGEINKIGPAEFAKIIETVTLVDIRTPEEYAKEHIAGAVNINYKKRTYPDYINAIAKDKPVAIYCRSANRSGKAALIMQNLGFKKVYDLDGGIKAWKKSELPLVNEDNEANIALQVELKKGEFKGKPTVGKPHQINEDEFEKLIATGKVTLIDTRTPKEFAKEHIEGAINIDWKNRHFIENMLKQVTDAQPLAIYCRSGNRSTRAMFALGAVGYKEVYNLEHGIKSWKKANKPLKVAEVEENTADSSGEEGC